jgi:hypothetical protein
MFRLKTALQDKYSDRPDAMKLYSPANCESVELYFRGEQLAKVPWELPQAFYTLFNPDDSDEDVELSWIDYW